MFWFKDLVIDATTGPLIPFASKALLSILRKLKTEASLVRLVPIKIARLSLFLSFKLGFASIGLVGLVLVF